MPNRPIDSDIQPPISPMVAVGCRGLSRSLRFVLWTLLLSSPVGCELGDDSRLQGRRCTATSDCEQGYGCRDGFCQWEERDDRDEHGGEVEVDGDIDRDELGEPSDPGDDDGRETARDGDELDLERHEEADEIDRLDEADGESHDVEPDDDEAEIGCVSEAYSQCSDDDGNVYWFDSCGEIGQLKQRCPIENGACENLSEEAAICRCADGLGSAGGQLCNLCVRYVDVDSDAQDPTGLGWNSAFPAVQPGIQEAYSATQGEDIDECEVWVASGTYYIYQQDPTDQVNLRSNVGVYGGFDGREVARDARDVAEHETILDGHASEGSDEQVLQVVKGTYTSSIDGFTITGGRALGEDARDQTDGGEA